MPRTGPPGFEALLESHAITDIALYGDTRPIHAQAVEIARARGLRVHVLEEGYLRPYWVTYERGGANGHSRLMKMSIADMQEALAHGPIDFPEAPARWGDMRQHVFYGALYHAFVLLANRSYAGFRPHRDLNVRQEFRLYIRRLLLMPYHWLARLRATWRIRRGGFPYHLVLLQLEHDSSFQMHSPFSTMTEFLKVVMGGFAEGAPGHHHLVFKAHPLEDGRVNLEREINALARAHGLEHRVHYVRGGKLAQLLGPCPQRGHGELDRRATGAVARPAAEGLRRGGLFQARVRVGPAPGRILPPPCAPRQRRLSRLPAIPAGNQPGARRLLFLTGTATIAAATGGHDAGPRGSL